MQLNLSDEETLVLRDLLNTTIEGDRRSRPRIQMLRGTLAKLGPMDRSLEDRKRVKAEGLGAAAELDRRELERELRSVPARSEFDREVLERELQRSGPEGAAAAWGQVDAGLRTERANPRPPPRRAAGGPFRRPVVGVRAVRRCRQVVGVGDRSPARRGRRGPDLGGAGGGQGRPAGEASPG